LGPGVPSGGAYRSRLIKTINSWQMGIKPEAGHSQRLRKLESGAEGFGDSGDASASGGRHFAIRTAFAEDEPNAGTMHGSVAANRASQLRDFERTAGEFAIEDRPDFVEKILEALRCEHGIDVTRDGGFDLV
jgi:hypothetical protein